MTGQDGRMDLDDFLDHSGTASGGGFLKNWKEDGKLDIWLHPGGYFAALWAHRWYRLVKDRESEALIVRPMRWKCMESESILRKQKFRLDDDTREYPPCLCPLCLLAEWVRERINAGELEWTDELFKFEGDDEEQDEVVFNAGGITGQIQKAFQDKSITKEQRAALRKAGIRGDEVFMQALAARLQYVFTIVQHDDPSAGCLIALESQSLGDKLKKVIRDRREDVGDEGNPLVNPYAFRWIYDENKEFSAKYDVKAMTSLSLTDEVQAVFDEDPADISDLISPGNVPELRVALEEHYIGPIDVPWDDIFAEAEKQVKGTPAGEKSTDFNYGANQEGDEDEEDDGLYECEVCGKGSEDPKVCEHCGAEYDEDGNLTKDPREEEKPKRATRKRGAKKSAAKKAAKSSKSRGRK